MAEEDPLADPVAVIVTLQQYQKKLSSQVELLRQDVATSKTFQSKYGVRPTGVGCVRAQLVWHKADAHGANSRMGAVTASACAVAASWAMSVVSAVSGV
jgi:hypothetical protein